MPSHNVNNILSKNIQDLKAEKPLFINIKHDHFIDDYLSTYSEAQLYLYTSNFKEYSSYKKHSRTLRYFSEQYQTQVKHDLVIIAFPKSKAELNFTLEMIHHATTSQTNILIVGENKSGIKSIGKITDKILINCRKIDSARHCVIFSAKIIKDIKAFNIDEWFKNYTINISNIELKIAALPGVFSQKGLDKGTKVLLENLPVINPGNILDFGCGAGVIACFVGIKQPNSILHLVDVNALALASSKKTLMLNNVKADVFASNSLSSIKRKYDTVLSNPPFHQGLATNYNATEDFLRGISKHLHKQANVIIVANSFLKYQPIMEDKIGKTSRLIAENGFTLYQCAYS